MHYFHCFLVCSLIAWLDRK